MQRSTFTGLTTNKIPPSLALRQSNLSNLRPFFKGLGTRKSSDVSVISYQSVIHELYFIVLTNYSGSPKFRRFIISDYIMIDICPFC